MAKEGSTEAPIRHPLDFNHPDFLDPKKLDDEMRRAFDICHGCRRCFNLCDSFPKLFDLIDESENEDVDSLKSEQFKPVVDACTLCDMCFMTKCPYVPPHEFNLDFPHLMLRYRTAQKKNNELPKIPYQLAKIDRNGKIGVLFSKIINWMSDVKNNLFRKILEILADIDKRVKLPKYNSETFANVSELYFGNFTLLSISASISKIFLNKLFLTSDIQLIILENKTPIFPFLSILAN